MVHSLPKMEQRIRRYIVCYIALYMCYFSLTALCTLSKFSCICRSFLDCCCCCALFVMYTVYADGLTAYGENWINTYHISRETNGPNVVFFEKWQLHMAVISYVPWFWMCLRALWRWCQMRDGNHSVVIIQMMVGAHLNSTDDFFFFLLLFLSVSLALALSLCLAILVFFFCSRSSFAIASDTFIYPELLCVMFSQMNWDKCSCVFLFLATHL